MWKRIRWHLFGTATVVFVMHNDERRFGWAKKTGHCWHGSPWDYINSHYRLNADGSVDGLETVKGWEPFVGDIPFHHLDRRPKPQAVA